jgi:hypothetical protein
MNDEFKKNTSTYITLKNNGIAENYTNSCMFICIQQYLKIHNHATTVQTLRCISEFPGKRNEELDLNIPSHKNCLIKLANHLNLSIRVHPVDTQRNLIARHADPFGDGKNIVHIANKYSRKNNTGHYELITNAPNFGIILLPRHEQEIINDLYLLDLIIDEFETYGNRIDELRTRRVYGDYSYDLELAFLESKYSIDTFRDFIGKREILVKELSLAKQQKQQDLLQKKAHVATLHHKMINAKKDKKI